MSRTNKPIWQDTIVNETGVTLQHLVGGAWVDTDMRIMPVPSGYTPDAAINRYAENDLKSTMPDFDYSGTTAITLQPYAYQVYKASDNEIGFLNDWSYEDWSGDTRCMSAPINRHADSRQKLVYGNFSETGNSIIIKELIRPVIKIEPKTIIVSADQAATGFEITSNLPYDLSIDGDWLNIMPTSGSVGSQLVYVALSENHNFEDRQAVVTLTHESYWDLDTETITACTITQRAIVPSYHVSPLEQGITWDTSDLVNFVVNTNVPFTASTNASWLTYSGQSQAGYHSYNVYFSASTNSGDTRDATVFFQFQVDATGGTQVLTSVVRQNHAPIITIEPQSKNISGVSQSVMVQVYSEANWVASTSDNWLTVPSSGVSGTTLISIEADANTDNQSRNGSVLFSNGTRQVTFNILQSAITNTHLIYYTASPAQIITPSVTEGFGAVYIGSYHVNSDYYWAFESEPTAIPNSAFAGLAPLRSVTAPESVTSIGYSAFTQGNLTSITAPGVTTIGAYAFNGNKNLANVTFSGVTSVGEYAFNNCSALTSIDLTHIEYLGQSAFWRCKNLSNVELGSDLRYVPKACFGYCSGITSMVIPEGVTGMSWQVFTNCYNLSSVTLPNTLIEMGNENGHGGTFMYAYGLTSLTIPDSVKRIYGELCYGNGIITAVTIPESVEYLDEDYIEHFYSLKNMTIGARFIPVALHSVFSYSPKPSSITITTGVTEIKSWAFGSENIFSATTFNYTGTKAQWAQIIKGEDWAPCGTIIHCSNGDVSISEPVMRYISTDGNYAGPHDSSGGVYCFNNYKSGNTYTLTTTSKAWDIPSNAFSGYTNLESVEMVNIASIGYAAFNGCTVLKSMIFSENLTEIPAVCCYGCSALSAITLGSKIQTIGGDSFRECGSLNNITFEGTISQWNLITKGSNWNYQVPATVVHCSDGDTPL